MIRTSKLLCIKGILKLPFKRFHVLKKQYGKLSPSGIIARCWFPKLLLPKAMTQIGLFGHVGAGKGHGQINGNGTSKLVKL